MFPLGHAGHDLLTYTTSCCNGECHDRLCSYDLQSFGVGGRMDFSVLILERATSTPQLVPLNSSNSSCSCCALLRLLHISACSLY